MRWNELKFEGGVTKPEVGMCVEYVGLYHSKEREGWKGKVTHVGQKLNAHDFMRATGFIEYVMVEWTLPDGRVFEWSAEGREITG